MAAIVSCVDEAISSWNPTILDIATDDDPFLRIRAVEVDITDIGKNEEIQQLVVDMIATMKHANGIGLAAPQIRRSLRVIVFYLPATRDDIHGIGVPLTVLINPELSLTPFDSESGATDLSNPDCEKVKDYEGCLSVPGMRGQVRRAKKIYYRGYDANGNTIQREAEGWHARLLQHEFDHLNGVLYTDLMDDVDTLVSVDEWRTLTQKN